MRMVEGSHGLSGPARHVVLTNAAPITLTALARRPWLAPVPIPLTLLIGRVGDLAIASNLLKNRVRLLMLTGPGGVGKTHLAHAIAAAAEPDFADGVNWVALAAVRDSELVLDSIARSLGIIDYRRQSLLSTLADTLRQQRLFLVLNNAERLLAAAPRSPSCLRPVRDARLSSSAVPRSVFVGSALSRCRTLPCLILNAWAIWKRCWTRPLLNVRVRSLLTSSSRRRLLRSAARFASGSMVFRWQSSWLLA
jgi:hypothetical protein